MPVSLSLALFSLVFGVFFVPIFLRLSLVFCVVITESFVMESFTLSGLWDGDHSLPTCLAFKTEEFTMLVSYILSRIFSFLVLPLKIG